MKKYEGLIPIIALAKESCKCTPDETTGWIETHGIPCCNICGLPVEQEIENRKLETN